MPAELSRDVPDSVVRAEIVALAESVEAADGASPLSDEARTRLTSGGVDHLLAREGDRLVGYAQRDGDAVELLATTPAPGTLLDAALRPGSSVWSHGRRSTLVSEFDARGLRRARSLLRLERPLDELPAEPALPEGVRVRPFVPGQDEPAWLTVNAAAFADHPEQGSWTLEDLLARERESWFDPAGFLLAERDATLLGFHWTKIHPHSTGEVYVIATAPQAQGSGLGNALLVRGLRSLGDRGCVTASLYVDGDNARARGLYERSGFATADEDVQWRVPG